MRVTGRFQLRMPVSERCLRIKVPLQPRGGPQLHHRLVVLVSRMPPTVN